METRLGGPVVDVVGDDMDLVGHDDGPLDRLVRGFVVMVSA